MRAERNPAFGAFGDLDGLRRQRRQHREMARALRALVLRQDWSTLFDALGWYDGRHLLVLERAMPLMSADEAAYFLAFAWCRQKQGAALPRHRALRLFHAASALRGRLPTAWPNTIRVYRGAWGRQLEHAKRRIRCGIAWTTDRAVAMKFAETPSLEGCVSCIGTATVQRSAILAYFNDDDYHEAECLIDPASIARITYETQPGEAGLGAVRLR